MNKSSAFESPLLFFFLSLPPPPPSPVHSISKVVYLSIYRLAWQGLKLRRLLKGKEGLSFRAERLHYHHKSKWLKEWHNCESFFFVFFFFAVSPTIEGQAPRRWNTEKQVFEPNYRNKWWERNARKLRLAGGGWATNVAEIKVLSVEKTEQLVFFLYTWSRSEHSFACFASWHEFCL